MLALLKDWKGTISVDGETIERCNFDFKRLSADSHILLHSNAKTAKQSILERSESDKKEVRITVKAYMLKKATEAFDFMLKWNNDNPMPLRTMTGIVEKETNGMVYMNLRGEGFPTCTCMRCGRELTNPISKYYGIGPECMSKLGFVCDITEVEAIKLGMREIKWSGWIIKSAILKKEDVA